MTMTASEMLAQHWDGTLPVDVLGLAAALGIHVEAANQLDGGVSGEISLDEGGTALLRFNRTEAPVRQRFTVAHEIGHFALGHLNECGEGHKKLLRDPAANFSSGQSAWIEREANAFAADLLMPAKVLRYAVNERRILDVTQLATLFKVSQVAMRYRLQNLGLIRG